MWLHIFEQKDWRGKVVKASLRSYAVPLFISTPYLEMELNVNLKRSMYVLHGPLGKSSITKVGNGTIKLFSEVVTALGGAPATIIHNITRAF